MSRARDLADIADKDITGTLTADGLTVDGNVGIGTSSPSAGAVGGKVIHVQNSGATASVRVDRSDASTAGTLSITSGNTSIGVYGTGAKPMFFYTNSTERMTIDSSGNVGIGSSAPGMLLEVDASSGSANDIARFSGRNSGGLTFRNATANEFILHTATSDALIFGTNGNNERMRIDGSGNVGIGLSTNIASKLVVNSELSLGPDNNNRMIVGSTSGGVGSIGTIEGGTASFSTMTFKGGNVGIGVNDPDAVLDISGGSNKLGILRVTQRLSGATAYGLDVGLDPTSGDPVFSRIVNDVVSESFRIQRSSGNLGIGTSSPSRQLHINNASESNIRLQGGSDYAELRVKDADNALSFHFDGTERMRLQSNGNLVIGGTPAASDARLTLMHTDPALFFHDTSAGHNDGAIKVSNGSIKFLNGANTNDVSGLSERMRIDNSGNVIVGNSGAWAAGADVCMIESNGLIDISRNDTSTQSAIAFYNPNGGIGSITVGGSATAYNTSSDYRLKTDAQPMTGASARVQALNPVNFEWIASGDRVDGFLAHEAQAVVPEAVTGAKDAVDADGNPDYQGIDQSKLVPLLTAALQEALTKIDALETRITALEG